MRSLRRVRLALIALAALGASAAPRRPAAAEDPANPPGGARRCTVTGKVVDSWEDGVPGARVAWIGDAPAGDRSAGAAVQSDETGRYRLELDGPAGEEVRGTIHATRGDDGAALAPIVVGTDDRVKDDGTLELRSARPLYVDVRREGKPVPGATVWLWCWAGNVYRGAPAFVGTATADSGGRAVFGALAHDYVKLFVRAPDGSVGEQTRQVVPGSAASRLRVDLVPSRAIRVLVTTDAATALPVEGAAVSRRYEFALEDVVHHFAAHVPSRIPPTTVDGRVRVDGLPADETVELEARVAGRPAGRVECKPGETSATIVIPKPTTIPLQDGEGPRPPDGTRLVVRGRRTTRAGVEGWIQSGSIAVPLTEHEVNPGLAIAPDGSLAPLKRVEPTSFFRPRSLVVRIVEEGGRGVVGTRVSLASSPYVEGPWDTPIPTDGEGRARFDGLAPVKHFVYAFPTARHPHGSRVGEVDLRSGDATREVIVGAEGSILARVTVDGRPAVPEDLRLTIQNGVVVNEATDRAAGTVRINARPERHAPKAGSIEFSGKGVRSRRVAFPWPERGETTSIEVSLFASPEVVVDVRADPESDHDVYLEKWCPWNPESPWLASHDAYPHLLGRTDLELEKGRYRLHDLSTGIVSDPIEVPDRGQRIVATLDLTGLVTVRGRIECPDAADAEKVEIAVEGDGIDSHVAFAVPYGSGHGLSYDGKSFAVRVPAGRPVTLSPWHHTMQPARQGGEVTLVGPRDDVVLKMGDGATLVASLTDPSGRPLSEQDLSRALLAAIPAAHPTREPVLRSAKPVEGKPGTVSASGLPFGSLDVWVMTDIYANDGYAVRRVGRADVSGDVTDLGEVRLTRGSMVTIRRGRATVASPWVESVKGHAVGMFGPRQWLFSDPPATGADGLAEIRHLGAGHWYVAVEGLRRTTTGEVQEEREFEIDVDGEHDLTLEVDFDGPPLPTPK